MVCLRCAGRPCMHELLNVRFAFEHCCIHAKKSLGVLPGFLHPLHREPFPVDLLLFQLHALSNDLHLDLERGLMLCKTTGAAI